MQFTCPVIKEQKNRPSLAFSESWRITFVKWILYKALIKTTLQGVNWNEFQKQNSCQNYAFFWPYFYDPPAPDRPLIQMKNQERGEGSQITNPIVLWWPSVFRLGITVELLKHEMSTIQQAVNVKFLGVNLVFILLNRDQRERETI